MRTPEAMRALILGIAARDERIRAVLLNGSRANPAAPRDLFQDYDIVYLVRDVAAFAADEGVPALFGEPLLVQQPEAMRDPLGDGRYTYLMLFRDGSRIDLQLLPAEGWQRLFGQDSETVVWLDKDGLLPAFPPASDRDYHVQPPARLDYDSCCNNFWWCLQNVAKGIWRDELPYAMRMYNDVVRGELDDMAGWAIGGRHGWAVSPGKMGKYFRRYLTADEYAQYVRTYAGGDAAALWQAIDAMTALFGALARAVAASCGFRYREEEERRMTAYLARVRALPPDAVDFGPPIRD